MMQRLIILLVRTRLGLKQNEHFQFSNQKKPDVYWFTEKKLLKKTPEGWVYPSKVSLNWLLNRECRVRIMLGDDI